MSGKGGVSHVTADQYCRGMRGGPQTDAPPKRLHSGINSMPLLPQFWLVHCHIAARDTNLLIYKDNDYCAFFVISDHVVDLDECRNVGYVSWGWFLHREMISCKEKLHTNYG